jgi:Ca2+/Na+ antiporter
MAFPFQFSAKFSALEHSNYRFRQTDFFHLRDFVKRKYTGVEADREEVRFSLNHVFGFMSFAVTLKHENAHVRYTIDMMPVLLSVILVLFASLFMAQGSIMLSIGIGFSVFVALYVFSILIVNGMVRRILESFVNDDMKRFEKNITKPVCIHCRKPMKPGQQVCDACQSKLKDKPNEETQIKYTYVSDDKL